MPPRRSIRDEDWERLRPTIRKLYLEEDRSLKDVLLILGTCHSFYPSKAQLEWKLKQWHFTKNMSVLDWKYVGNEIHRRKCQGKESKVYLSGIPLRMKATERGLSRYCYKTAIEKAMRYVPEPPMPQDQPLLVCTPAPEEMSWPRRVDNIPWLLSRRLIGGLSIKVQRDMRITYDSRVASSEGLVGSILFPWCDLQLESYTTLLGKTFKALRSIMPEEHEGAHATRAQCLLQKGRSNTINAEVLVFLVFLLSNDLFGYQNDLEQQERHTATTHLLLRLFRDSGSDALANGCYSSLPLSLQASLDGLFREAIKTSDLEAVEILLQAGVDVNTSFCDYIGSSGTALQHAASANQSELLQLLIGHGADTQKIDIKILSDAWFRRKTSKGSSEETMKILMSIYRFHLKDERHAVHLLSSISHTPTTPVTEALIEFFWVNFSECSLAAKSQLLITAIRTNSRFIGNLVAESSGYVNSCGYYPETPMTAAVYMDNIHLCRQLLHRGAILEPDHEAATPLQWAASYGDVRMVEQLIHEGADLNFCHPCPTFALVSFEDFNSMRLPYSVDLPIIQYPEANETKGGSLGKTALHAALLGGNTATSLFLLTAGAKLVGGELVMAIWSRQSEIIGSILDKGASFQDECIIFDTDTALEAAILSDNIELVHQIIAADARLITGRALCASVFSAKVKSDLTILRYLLKHASHLPSSEDTWVGTAMCFAAHLGCMEVSELMLGSGLHPATSWPLDIYQRSRFYDHMKGFSGSIPGSSVTRSYLSWRRSLRTRYRSQRLTPPRRPIIEVAISLDHIEFLKLLFGYGYQPQSTSWLGILSQNNINLDTLRRLHDLGVKMTERVLVHVIGSGEEIVNWLLSVGVDVNERSEQHFLLLVTMTQCLFPWTPLQQAALHGDVDLVQQLIDHGADVNEPPYPHGATSLQCATERGFFGIVQRLLQLGANPNAPAAAPTADFPQGGRTAIETAAEHGRLDILRLLLNSGVGTSGIGRRQYVRSVALAGKEGYYACKKLLKSHAGWTDADEILLYEEGKDLFPFEEPPTTYVLPYVRCYYRGQSDEKDMAEDESPVKNQLSDDVESSPETSVAYIERAQHCDTELRREPLSEEEGASEAPLGWDDTCCKVQELTEKLDEPSATLLSTFDTISNLPDAYEALSEEVGLDFLPSSMSYQIREELEGGGCLEELGDDVWAEEYSRFIAELV